MARLNDLPVSAMLWLKKRYLATGCVVVDSVELPEGFEPPQATLVFTRQGPDACEVRIQERLAYVGRVLAFQELGQRANTDGVVLAVRETFEASWTAAATVLRPGVDESAAPERGQHRRQPRTEPEDCDETALSLERIAELDQVLRREVLGQPHAAQALVGALRRRALLGRDPERPRPVAVAMFAGPSGVGKTETARLTAKILYGDDAPFVRVDCSELYSSHVVSTLVGAPPGFVGYGDDTAILARPLREHRNGVLLFDEVDKAYSDAIFTSVLFGLLGKGSVRDASNATQLDATGYVVVMTTNAGTGHDRSRRLGFDARDTLAEISESVHASLARRMPPEVFGRIDDIIVFEPLSDDVATEIIRRECCRVDQQLRQGAARARLVVSEECIPVVLEKARPRLELEGARAVHKAVRRCVADAAVEVLATNPEASRLRAHVANGDVVVSVDGEL